MMMAKFLYTTLLLLVNICAVSGAPILQDGFEDDVVVDNTNVPGMSDFIDFKFTPNEGWLLLITKKGIVYIIKDLDEFYEGNDVAQIALDLGSIYDDNNHPILCTYSSRGLGSIAIHPNFTENGYIYLYYTFAKYGTCDQSEVNGPVTRLSRFVLDRDNLSIDYENTEHVIFDTQPLKHGIHNHGCVDFGPSDGLLYVTHGDGDEKTKSQDLRNLFGKVMRFNDDGSIPESNPYYDASDSSADSRCNRSGMTTSSFACQEIYASGLRNAFRCAMNHNVKDETIYHLMDVGAAHWEEISIGGTNYAGVNYGWPIKEGPCDKGTTGGAGCAPNPSIFQDPFHYYQHNTDGEGASVGGAFIPNGIWPDEYDNSFLFNDYIFNTIYLIHPYNETYGDGCRECDTPVSEQKVTIFASQVEKPVTMIFGPYRESQALYYISRDSPQTVHRIAYIGESNRKPTAVIELVDGYLTDGPVGHTVQLDGTNSYDPDSMLDFQFNDIVSYEWDLNGDGVIDSTSAVSDIYTYTSSGSYEATLTGTDLAGYRHSTSIRINVGNKPTPNIINPVDGTTFAVGDVVTITGSAHDIEDGELDDTSLSWEVRQHHEQHYHPFLDVGTPGNGIVLDPIPGPEDFYAATSSYIEILLTATDSDGLSSTVSRTIMPKIKNLTFATNLPNSNILLMLDGSPIVTPEVAVSWIGHQLPIDAPNQCGPTGCYNFIAWSDDGSQLHEVTITEELESSFVATYQKFEITSSNVYDDNVLLIEDEFINSGEIVSPPGLNVYLEQKYNGNLILHKGNNGISESVLWESGVDESSDVNYFTRLTKGGVLSTRSGTPENKGKPIWSSSTSKGIGHFFLAVSSDLQLMSIFQGVASNPLNIEWSAKTDYVLTQAPQQPTLPPPTVILPPTLQPSITASTTKPTTRLPTSLRPTRGQTPQPSPTTASPSLGVAPVLNTPPTVQPSAFASSNSTKATSSPTNTLSALASSNVILIQAEYITVGETKSSSELDVHLEQQSNGNLVLYEGTIGKPVGILWQSGFNGTRDLEYFTRLQGDGVLATKVGSPQNRTKALWKSHIANVDDRVEANNQFFLAVTSDKKKLAIFMGKPENSLGVVWVDGLSLETLSPTGEPTLSPTTEPTAKPVSARSSSPTTTDSVEPTVLSTTDPSSSPTVLSTTDPSSSPTVETSFAPSIVMSRIPSTFPTDPPTPTMLPTVQTKDGLSSSATSIFDAFYSFRIFMTALAIVAIFQ